MEEAIFLTKFASKVTIVHRRDEFRASQIMIDRARNHEKIEILTPYVVEEVLGVDGGKLTGVRLRNVETGETLDYPTDGLFVAIGHDPKTKLFVDALDHDENGYLITQPAVDGDQHPGRVRRGRRPGSRVPPGDHRRRLRLRRGTRRGALSRGVRGASRGCPDGPARAHRAGLGTGRAGR